MNKINNLPLKTYLTRMRNLVQMAAFVTLLIYASWNALAYRDRMVRAIDTSDAGNDMVSTWDRRMRKILPDLPDHGVVGYLADWDIPGYEYGHTDQTVEYLLSQYALAPLTLQRGDDFPLIIGNFSDTGDKDKIPAILAHFKLVLVKEHTNEIFILEPAK
jgi:hypothetical protein